MAPELASTAWQFFCRVPPVGGSMREKALLKEMTDHQLLRAFVDERDQRAFARIVERYLHVVYAAARRQCGGDEHLAEDVAQAVFIMLARKAASLGDGTVLAGWLVNAARLAAKTAVRGEMRRKRREQRVADMNVRQQEQQTRDPRDPGAHHQMQFLARAGEEVVAKLDDALGNLNLKDRTAITLRYLQERPMSEVAAIMGISEPAASKRVTRAIAKLRSVLERRGIDIAPAALLVVLEQEAQVAPPPHISAQAIAHSALHATTASATAATIATAALGGFMRGAVWKTAAGITAAMLVLASTLTISFVVHRVRGGGAPTVDSTGAESQPHRMQLQPPTIRVGFYISLRTAEFRGLGYPEWGDQFALIDDLAHEPRLECVPVVENPSIADGELALQLAHYFPGKLAVDVTDASAMRGGAGERGLDVLVVCEVHHPPDQALAAIEGSVRDGMGLVVRQCLGGDDSGYAKRAVRNLRLFDQAEPDAVRPIGAGEAVIAGEHPLLGALSGHTDVTIRLAAYGAYGTLLNTATPLLRLKDLDAVTYDKLGAITPKSGYGVYPLAAGQLGKGRIVSCSFESNGPPRELKNATGGKFDLRAVLWAAGQPLEP